MTITSILLAASAMALTASTAIADTYFEHGRTLDADDTLQLGLITSDAAGVLEIYDYHTGQQGKLLGARNLRAGANTDVRVDTGLPTRRDVIAIVRVDGQIVASKRFDVE